MSDAHIIIGDVRTALSSILDGSVQTCITSPPYWGLRDYGHGEQIGLEQTPDDYVAEIVAVFREVWRVLADDGTLWLNLGDSYAAMRDSKATPDTLRNGDGTKVLTAANRNPNNLKNAGLKHKDLVGIPWRVAFALQADGWYLRQDIIWHKPNPMPESVTDRCTKAHEYVFLLTKSARYHFDNEAIKEPSANLGATNIRFGGNKYGDSDDPKHATKSGNTYVDSGTRNKRSVWTINTKPFKSAHFAVMPEALVEPCVLASSKTGDIVLDPFAGSGTVGVVALRHGRKFLGVELNPEYADLANDRITNDNPMFNTVTIERTQQ
jgi:DNA modification methylase